MPRPLDRRRRRESDTDEAIRHIHKAAKGIPRRINNITATAATRAGPTVRRYFCASCG